MTLRPTRIKTGHTWSLQYQQGLLSKKRKRSLDAADQDEERAKAFDLLDALSRSGALPIESGVSLHVILAATHCFDKTLMDTIVQVHFVSLHSCCCRASSQYIMVLHWD